MNRIIGGDNYEKPIGIALAVAVLVVVAWFVSNYLRNERLREILELLGAPNKKLTKKQEDGILRDPPHYDIFVVSRTQNRFSQSIEKFINEKTKNISIINRYKGMTYNYIIWSLEMIGRSIEDYRDRISHLLSDKKYKVLILESVGNAEISDEYYAELNSINASLSDVIVINLMKFNGNLDEKLLKNKEFMDLLNNSE